MRHRIGLVALAVALGVLPVSEDVVEQAYSTGLYPRLQAALTSTSNWMPFALFDVLIIAVAGVWGARLWQDARRHRWFVTLGRLAVRTVTMAAALYVVFLLAWGFNYRRVPLEAKLEMRYAAVTPEGAERLARAAVLELNRLHPRRTPDRQAVNRSLPAAFASVQARLGPGRSIVPGRPKRTLLDPYFRAASVDGMTDPFFLETLMLSTLLPVERPMVVAHEWAHLAGYADEGEANFVGWLACLDGDAAARYSAWLFLYIETAPGLDGAMAADVGSGLDPGPRADLAAIARRVHEQRSPAVATVGWGLYDQYLKANGVERGTRSYTDVVRFVLGTAMGTDALARVTAPGESPAGAAARPVP